MRLAMKKFNILGIHWKIRVLGTGGGVTKNQCKVGLPKKGEAWIVYRFKGGGPGKKGGVVFLRAGVLIPQCALWWTE